MSDLASIAACGTYAGFQQHKKLREKPCEPCREARNLYMRDYRRSSPKRKSTWYWYTRTRDQALEKLAAEYPARFLEILDEIRAGTPKDAFAGEQCEEPTP